MSHSDPQLSTMYDYDPLCTTMIIFEQLWSKEFSLRATMTQNVLNRFILTQNKVLWLFIFLYSVPIKSFLDKIGFETSKCFVLNET